MNVTEVAKALGAKRIGKGKYRGCCPAHAGSNRSALAIWEGKTAVLLKCFTMDCAPSDILKTVGLKRKDLFYAQTTDPKVIRDAMRMREAAEKKERAHHKRCIYLADMVRKSELILWSLELGAPEWHKALDDARIWVEHFNTAMATKQRTEAQA